MKRVTRGVRDDGPLPEEQETEGQRQLHCLLLQQLSTDTDINRCVAKKKCFAPAAVYKPFGEQAAGVRSLAQFQALQDGERELASLRELGLTDPEIQLWKNREHPENESKSRGVCVAPEARDQRLQVIQEKMAARAELLSRPQRFSASRALSRREMEIEKALFHGSDRSSFLTALYHQEEDSQNDQQGAASSKSMDSLYRDFLKDPQKGSDQVSSGVRLSPHPASSDRLHVSQTCTDKHLTRLEQDSSQTPVRHTPSAPTTCESEEKPSGVELPQKVTVNQQIRHLSGSSGPGGPVRVTGRVEETTDDEIRNNREPEEFIRKIPRFQNYQRGEPAKVLCVKNISPRASLAQLVSLFSRFQKDDKKPNLYRLLTGRLKGQAFITFSDVESAQAALDTVNGYRLLDKPLVIEFGRERTESKSENSSGDPCRATAEEAGDPKDT